MRFGDALIPITTETKNLGIWLTLDCSWLRQIVSSLNTDPSGGRDIRVFFFFYFIHVNQKGTYSLHAMRTPVRSSSFSLTTKLNIIKSYLIPAMTFGLDFWAPERAAERTAFATLDSLLTDAMHTILQLRRGPDSWRHKRRLKADVLFNDVALLRMARLSDTARARYRYRIDPSLRKPATRNRALTSDMPSNLTVWPLPADLPWLRATTDLAPAPAGGRLRRRGHDPTAVRPAPLHADITAAGHRDARIQAYATHGPAVSAAGRKRTRSQTAAPCGPALDPLLSSHRMAPTLSPPQQATCAPSLVTL